ncbi:hypothetical protein Bca52824_012418 [Brassica carinata]|uniref:Serine O-acetyltransferase n=1 Tax=Brassica carinata TaxID=52824 RepID=A0A8X7VY56_BRACI|nr:hypothetical protein Bca52824_012418 [Brassica carinata]
MKAARIGEGILLDHGTGVVIGCVTLGGTGKETGDGHPIVGDSALLGACIGARAMVAAGSLIKGCVPSHSMVAGNPAKLIGFVDEQDQSLTMEHVLYGFVLHYSSELNATWLNKQILAAAFRGDNTKPNGNLL